MVVLHDRRHAWSFLFSDGDQANMANWVFFFNVKTSSHTVDTFLYLGASADTGELCGAWILMPKQSRGQGKRHWELPTTCKPLGQVLIWWLSLASEMRAWSPVLQDPAPPCPQISL